MFYTDMANGSVNQKQPSCWQSDFLHHPATKRVTIIMIILTILCVCSVPGPVSIHFIKHSEAYNTSIFTTSKEYGRQDNLIFWLGNVSTPWYKSFEAKFVGDSKVNNHNDSIQNTCLCDVISIIIGT